MSSIFKWNVMESELTYKVSKFISSELGCVIGATIIAFKLLKLCKEYLFKMKNVLSEYLFFKSISYLEHEYNIYLTCCFRTLSNLIL